jgi:hypothetical protein
VSDEYASVVWVFPLPYLHSRARPFKYMGTVGLETVSPSALPTTAAGGQIVGNPEEADEAPVALGLAADLGAAVVATAMVAEVATMHRALMMVMRVFFMFGPPR